MPQIETLDEIEYPESDGKPMAETELHGDWMLRIRDILRQRYRGQRVYVTGNLLVYYREGDPRQCVAPDVFVVKDCDPGRRRTFKTWEEGRTPQVVFEVTSRSTRGEDEVSKPQVYARLGVHEYFLYDPTADYLSPPLQGYRLERGGYGPIRADAAGALECQALDVLLCVEDGRLAMYDRSSGRLLHSEAETLAAARDAAEAQRDWERAARETAEAARDAAETACRAAEARAAQLEAELQRLRDAAARDRPRE
jgi:Uma2 family endonuclease